jgi:hypothetical protein
MPPGTVGNLAIKHLGFKYNGWGVASTLYGMFSQDDPDADYFSNSRALNFVAIKNEIAHVSSSKLNALLRLNTSNWSSELGI